jgi:hypothetical protein
METRHYAVSNVYGHITSDCESTVSALVVRQSGTHGDFTQASEKSDLEFDVNFKGRSCYANFERDLHHAGYRVSNGASANIKKSSPLELASSENF